MDKKSIQIHKIIIAILMVMTCALAFVYISERNTVLRVYFLDVGQGDAIYIRMPGGHDMLVDGGPSKIILEKLRKVMPWYDRTIDIVVETHPDADHIGGLPSILERFHVEKFIEPGIESDNAIDDAIRMIRAKKGVESILARRGMRVRFSQDAYFDVLYPDRDVTDLKDTNDASIVGKMVYGSTSVMLTGDAPKSVESRLVLAYGTDLQSDILKAGHHGSKTSSGKSFVEAVSPEYAVISAGKNNRYGHPHKEVVDLFKILGIPILATAESGTIEFTSDGKVFVKK